MVKPKLIAILFADQVITEDKTGKKSIIGTFTKLQSRHFPAVFPQWFIYIALKNIPNNHKYQIELIAAGHKKKLFVINGEVWAETANAVAELVFSINQAYFPKGGLYKIIVKIDDVKIGTRDLEVAELMVNKES
jgi:hypothetical protein